MQKTSFVFFAFLIIYCTPLLLTHLLIGLQFQLKLKTHSCSFLTFFFLSFFFFYVPTSETSPTVTVDDC